MVSSRPSISGKRTPCGRRAALCTDLNRTSATKCQKSLTPLAKSNVLIASEKSISRYSYTVTLHISTPSSIHLHRLKLHALQTPDFKLYVLGIVFGLFAIQPTVDAKEMPVRESDARTNPPVRKQNLPQNVQFHFWKWLRPPMLAYLYAIPVKTCISIKMSPSRRPK